MRLPRRLFALLLAAAAVPGAAAAQDEGIITGTVTEQGTDRPLASVQIFLAGTSRGTLTNEEGRYVLAGVNPGTYAVQATFIGYTQGSQSVTVVPGETITADFALATSAVELGAVVVTATGARESKREIGNSIGTIDVSEDIVLAAVTSFTNVLQGRTAGVSVMSASGSSGTGQRVRIRGSNSVSLSNDPLLVIDGIRADNSMESMGVGGQNLSRLSDINPEDIETIEILKGPAASALYGTAAANGVIVVTTKKGIAGTTRFNAFMEFGTIEDVTDYPANYRGFCSIDDGSGGRDTFGYCDIGTLGDPANVSLNIQLDSVASFNPLEDARSTPFESGARRSFGISAAGGNEQATYFLSAGFDKDDGLYRYGLSHTERKSVRANIRTQLTDGLNVTVNSGYTRSDGRLPQNDNNALGVIPGALLSSELGYDTTSAGYGFGIRPDQIALIDTEQSVGRLTGSVTADWRPVDWLSFIGTAGMDRVSATDQETVPPGQVPYSPTLLEGSRDQTRGITSEYTVNFTGNATYQLTPDLTGTSSVGGQYNEQLNRSTSAFGALLLPGVPSLEGANARFDVGESNLQVRTIGGYLQQKLGWRNRMFLAVALRADDNSAFGNDFGLAYYPSASLSWVVGDEPFFPDNGAISTLRLRAAAGRSGLRPGVLDAFRFFDPVAVSTLQGSLPGFTIGGAGNPNLKPERITEYEVGFDAGLMNDRIGLEFTYYHKTSEDALVSRTLPPSLGISTTRRENLGGVTNSGIEGLLRASILEMEDVQWDATLTAARLHNELTDLGVDPVTGEPLPPIIFGLGGSSQRHQEGYPLGAYFFRPYTFADENGDGIIIPSEITFTADTAEFMGNPFPTREASLSSSLALFGTVRISGLLDYRGGYELYNSSEEFRCGSFLNCETIYNPDAPLEEQARAIEILYFGNGTGYLEDASFVKLREVSVTFLVPSRFTTPIGTEALSITLSGRNLATWTDYTGLDPEINFAGSASNFTTAEFLTQPPARFFTARVDVTF